MAKVNNYPYTNMVYQNVDWIVDAVKEAEETSEQAMQIAQETALRVDGIETDVRDAQAQLARHEIAIDQNSTEISSLHSQLETLENNKVDKTNVEHRVYGTNGSGEQITYAIDVTNELRPVSVVVRSANGTVRTPAPVLNNDAANKKYVDDANGWNTAIDDTIETALDTNSKIYPLQNIECKELKITTIIDNGDTNPESYTSTDLDVSVNGGFFFSIDGAVPRASSPVRKTEDFSSMYTWDWSDYGFGNVTAQILTEEKFTRDSLIDANVTLSSYLSGYNYEITNVDESASSASAPGYTGYRVTLKQSGDPTNVRYGVLVTQAESVCPGLEAGMLCICSFDAGGDISDLWSGQWAYTGVEVAHKIATGTLDMKYINTEMAETETSGSGNRDDIDDGHIIPASNIKHYAIHPADSTISTVQVRVSNGVIREGTRIIIQYKK